MPSAGDRVAASGIYRSVHPKHRDADRDLAFIKGGIFRACPQCSNCQYELLRAAPSPQEDEDLKAPEGKTIGPVPAKRGAKVLAISYDKALLDTRKMILELSGFEVTTALGMNEGLAMCRHAAEFDLVVLGSSIPLSDKAQLLAEAKRPGSVKVLSIRAAGMRPLPGADYTIDPFYEPQALAEMVRAATAPAGLA
jgi:CheY-like chemotaxis protein